MSILLKTRKIGDGLYIPVPAKLRKTLEIRFGDCFELERDVLLPNMYTLKKIGNVNGNIEKTYNI